MSAATKSKVDKFLKTKKLDGELTGKYTFVMRWPLGVMDISSPSFPVCGSMWSISVYPIGIDETGDFLSLRLVNLSEEEVFASYVFSLKNARGGEDHVWKDPEGIVLFSSKQDGDNAWGSDEFIALADLHLTDDFTADEKITLDVKIEVFGRDYLKTETLSKEILDTTEKGEIIKLADSEIMELTKKLPPLRNSVAQKKKEDGLIKSHAHGK
jgi:hypothetical protein